MAFINVPPYHELFDEYGNPTDKNPAKRMREQNRAFMEQLGIQYPPYPYQAYQQPGGYGGYDYPQNPHHQPPPQEGIMSNINQQRPPVGQQPPYPYQADNLYDGIEENGYARNVSEVFFGQTQKNPQTPREYKRGFTDPRKVVTRIDVKNKTNIKAQYQAARTYAELVLDKINNGSVVAAPMDIWADDFIVDIKLYEGTAVRGKEVDEVMTIYNMVGGYEPIYRIDRNHICYPIYHTEDHAFKDESLVKAMDIRQYEGIVIEKSIRIPLMDLDGIYARLNNIKKIAHKMELLKAIKNNVIEYIDNANKIKTNLMVEMSIYYCYSVDALNRGNRYLYLPETDVCLYVGVPDADIVHPTDSFDLKYMFQIEKEVGHNIVIDIIDNRNKISDKRYVYLFGRVKEIPVRRNVPGIKDGIYIIETRDKTDINIEYFPLDAAEDIGIYRTEEEAETNGNPEILKSLELQQLKERLEKKKLEYEEKLKGLKVKEKEILNNLASESGKEKLTLQKRLNEMELEKQKLEKKFKEEKMALEKEKLKMEHELKIKEQKIKEERHRMEQEKMELEAKLKEEQHKMEVELEAERRKREKLAGVNNTLKLVAAGLTVVVSILGIYRTATAL